MLEEPTLSSDSWIAEGDYEILKAVGKGGSSTVFKAASRPTGQAVAIKQIDTEGLSSEQLLSIKGEIDTMKGLSHEHIVSYLGTRTRPGKILIFLEYADRGSLRQFYQRRGPLTEPQVANCTRQILEGLVYLHGNGIAHRDIKCANCLLTKGGVIKLADFGASKRYECESVVSGLKGTPHWMAPEVIRGTQMTTGWIKADVWSLGCTVVEMLTAKLPFSNYDNPMTAMYHIANGEAPSAKDVAVSADLGALVTACCAADPMQRPDTESLFALAFLMRRGREAAAEGGAADRGAAGPRVKGTPEPFMSPDHGQRAEPDTPPDLAVQNEMHVLAGALLAAHVHSTPVKAAAAGGGWAGTGVGIVECGRANEPSDESRIDTSLEYSEGEYTGEMAAEAVEGALEVDDCASDYRGSESEGPQAQAGTVAEAVAGASIETEEVAEVPGDNSLRLQNPSHAAPGEADAPTPNALLEDMPTPVMSHGPRNFFPEQPPSSADSGAAGTIWEEEAQAMLASEAALIQAAYAGQRPGHAQGHPHADSRSRARGGDAPSPAFSSAPGAEEPPPVVLNLPHKADRIRSRTRASPTPGAADLSRSADSSRTGAGRGAEPSPSNGSTGSSGGGSFLSQSADLGHLQPLLMVDPFARSAPNPLSDPALESPSCFGPVPSCAPLDLLPTPHARPKAPLTSDKLRRVAGVTAGAVRRAAQAELAAHEEQAQTSTPTRALRAGLGAEFNYAARPSAPGFPVFRAARHGFPDAYGARSKSASVAGEDKRLPPMALLALARAPDVSPALAASSLAGPARHIHSAPALSRSLNLPPIQSSSTPTHRANPKPSLPFSLQTALPSEPTTRRPGKRL